MRLPFSLLLALAASCAPMANSVTMDECKDTYLPILNSCLLAGEGPCDPLPIPDSARAVNTPNENGYWLEHLRNTANTHIFAIADGTYNSMIVVDVAPETEVGKRRHHTMLRRGLQSDESETVSEEMFPPEESVDEVETKVIPPGSISFGIIDMPENYYQYGEDGSVVGYGVFDAMEEILGILDATLDDVAEVQMIYSHAHFDHIGAANYTYNRLWNLGFEDVRVVSSSGTLHYLEELIEAGVYSGRAPLPTETFDEKTEHTIGAGSTIMMEPVDGHQFGGRDVIVFVPADGEEQPAIMFLVDIVFPKWCPFQSFAVTTDLLAYIKLHDKVLFEYDLGDDGYYVGGHITQTGNRMDVEANKNLTMAVMDNVVTALSTVDFGAVVGPTGAFDPESTAFGNTWLSFNTYLGAVHRECARLTIEQWGCTFAGLDIFVESLCTVAQFFVRIDT